LAKVSIVTGLYNCEKYISETIDSVLMQTHTDWEHIIIDDGSSDAGADIVREYANKDSRIKLLINEKNLGCAETMNVGINNASGDYIAILDQDDIWYPDKLVRQIQFLEEHQEVVMVSCVCDILENGEVQKADVANLIYNNYAEQRLFHLFFNEFKPHSGFLIRKQILDDYNIRYRRFACEDYDMILQLLLIGEVDYIHEALLSYRVFPEQFMQTCNKETFLHDRDILRTDYLSHLEISNKVYIEKALKCQMHGTKDFRAFEKEFELLIKYTEEYNNQSISRGAVEDIYYRIFYAHLRCPKNMVAYLTSPYSKKSWIKSKAGQKWIVDTFLEPIVRIIKL